MRNKILSLCVAAAAFVGLLPTGASAHESVAPSATQTAVAALPSTAHVNATMVVERHRPYRRYRHGYYRRHGRYYRHHHYYGRRYHHRRGVRIYTN